MSDVPTDDVSEDEVSLSEDAFAEPELAEIVDDELDELSQLAQERDEFRAMAQRLQADFENYRKRTSRLADEAAARQAADVVANLLPVLDTLELAQAHISPEAQESIEAKALIQARAQLLDSLTKQGLEPVPGAGEPFDPQVHDAVAHAADEDGTTDGPVVDEVLRAGFSWRGAVLRPAMVRVKG